MRNYVAVLSSSSLSEEDFFRSVTNCEKIHIESFQRCIELLQNSVYICCGMKNLALELFARDVDAGGRINY
ncbi:CLUMA_CG010645, isoform A [Clunio marinus]|uniref:CLUMA_CG010645, isoform A n=1 Tax=Clunio marinus TaxID=568069 RepID=A0A1J1IFM1_9DIPT|nr:CLUMA_CG010645, isoform A [Clunio marinus]